MRVYDFDDQFHCVDAFIEVARFVELFDLRKYDFLKLFILFDQDAHDLLCLVTHIAHTVVDPVQRLFLQLVYEFRAQHVRKARQLLYDF